MNSKNSLFGPDNPEIDEELQKLTHRDDASRQAAVESLQNRLRLSAVTAVEWLVRSGFYEAHPTHPGLIELGQKWVDQNAINKLYKVGGRPREDNETRDRLIVVLMDRFTEDGLSRVVASGEIESIICQVDGLKNLSSGSIRNVYNRMKGKPIEEIEKE